MQCFKKIAQKQQTVLPGQPSTISFNYIGGPLPWHVDVDLAGAMKDFDGGFLKYTIEVTDPKWFLDDAALAANVMGGTVTKDIFTNSAFSGSPVCSMTAGASQYCDFTSVNQIWVRDTWTASTGGTDNFSNDFSQVPAPLPILGAGAAFGSIRKLRKFSTQLKTFSMN